MYKDLKMGEMVKTLHLGIIKKGFIIAICIHLKMIEIDYLKEQIMYFLPVCWMELPVSK